MWPSLGPQLGLTQGGVCVVWCVCWRKELSRSGEVDQFRASVLGEEGITKLTLGLLS